MGFLNVLFEQLKKIMLWLMAIKVLIGWICAAITIVYVLWFIIKRLLRKLDRRGKPPIGKYFKEQRMNTITLHYIHSPLEKHRDTQKRVNKQYDLRMFVLEYEAVKEVTKNKVEALNSRKANERLLLQFEKEAAAMLAENNPCLFDRYGYVSEFKGEGEITDASKHADRSFYLGNEQNLLMWLSRQQKIINRAGGIIGVRGIDEKTVETLLSMSGGEEYKISELIVPDVDEETLCKMSLTQLLIFCDIRNCKFKINNGTFPPKCHFEFSETSGYTGLEMCEKIKTLAESKGYQFKII